MSTQNVHIGVRLRTKLRFDAGQLVAKAQQTFAFHKSAKNTARLQPEAMPREILIIDEHTDSQRTLETLVREAFHEVVVHPAATFQIGEIKAAELQWLDLVVMDLAIPSCTADGVT